jgi:hypothetical protein
MPYQRKTRGRGPTRDELALLQRLAKGPTSALTGPVGQIVKRGWVRLAQPELFRAAQQAHGGKHPRQTLLPLYVLTTAGAAILSGGESSVTAPAGPPCAPDALSVTDCPAHKPIRDPEARP